MQFPITITQASKLIQTGVVSSQTLTQYYLEKIKLENPKLNAFITIAESEALLTAKQLDNEIITGKYRGFLHGIPIAIKDNIDTANIPTTVGSELFRHRVPLKDADVISKLKAAGAVILGKTNLSEFAADIRGNNPFYGNVRNARNTLYSPGGSSSGIATAIAANLCLGGIGSDTGGSIRIPASWSGIVGMRTTQSVVSKEGVFPRAPSFDAVGVMANTVEDAEILFNAIINSSAVDTTLPHSFRLGVIPNFTFRGVDVDVAAAIHRILSLLKQSYIDVVAIENKFFSRESYVKNYSTIALYEFSQILKSEYTANSSIFGDKVSHDLQTGTTISRNSYEQAQKQRQIIQLKTIFKNVDAIITPTTPTPAPPLECDGNIYRISRQFVLPFSFLGFPAISIPCGINKQGLPIGLQVIANHFQDRILFKIAKFIIRHLWK